MTDPQERLSAMGMPLPPVPLPVASYVPFVRTGPLVFTAGQVPRRDGAIITGVVGSSIDPSAARDAAAIAAVQAIAAVKEAAGDLRLVRRIVKATVFVSSAPDFHGQSSVADGASELLEAAFGSHGKHARSAVGVAALPGGACVEVELIAEIGEPQSAS